MLLMLNALLILARDTRHMDKIAANTGMVLMALVALDQYSSMAQGVIDDGLAADRLTAGSYTRGANGLRREGVIPNIN
jgi:hypothetical protein